MGKRWPGMSRLRAERKVAAQLAAARAAAAVRARETTSDLLETRAQGSVASLFERLHQEPLEVLLDDTPPARRRVRRRSDRRQVRPHGIIIERPCAARGHNYGCECADYVWEPLHA